MKGKNYIYFIVQTILFKIYNHRYPTGITVEQKFNFCRSIYENRFNIYCYKCVTSNVEPTFMNHFNIKEIPAFIFYRDGEEFDRFEDADQPCTNAPEGEQDPKEYELRTYLDKLCAQPDSHVS